MLLTNANVLTLDPRRPRADELAVVDGRIAATEANDARTSTVIDLDGATVVPGFVDHHTHFRAWAVARHRIDLHDLRKLADLFPRLRAASSGDWVLGAGWGDDLLPPGTRIVDELVDAVDGRFVALMSRDSHALLTTDATLEQLGLTLDQLDIPGGIVERDSAGDFTGVLREESAWVVRRALPETDIDDKVMADGLREAARRGVTALHDMDGAQALPAWRSLDATRGLAARITLHMLATDMPHLAEHRRAIDAASDRLQIGGLKLFADGTLGSGTALLHAPEIARDGHPPRDGVSILEQDELTQWALDAAAAGLPLLVHAIGDRAFTIVVDALEATAATWQPLAGRPRIEHAQLTRHADLARCAELGIELSVQPTMLVTDRDEAAARWGERTARSYAYRWMLDAGCAVRFGSDAPIEDIAPLAAMHAAITRDGGAHGLAPARGAWHREQAITPLEALQATCHGPLVAGAPADLVVLSGDPLQSPLDEIAVLGTMVGGAWTFRP